MSSLRHDDATPGDYFTLLQEASNEARAKVLATRNDAADPVADAKRRHTERMAALYDAKTEPVDHTDAADDASLSPKDRHARYVRSIYESHNR